MATKQELISQIQNHKESIPKLEALLVEVPKQIEQLKEAIRLKNKALAEITEKEEQIGKGANAGLKPEPTNSQTTLSNTTGGIS